MANSAIVAGALLASSAVAAHAQSFFGTGGAVYARFIGSEAVDISTLFYKIGGGAGGPIAGYTAIFTNGGGGDAPGTQKSLGVVGNGVEVFFALRNASQGNIIFYSGTGSGPLNPDGQVHTQSQAATGTAVSAALVPAPPASLTFTNGFGYEDRSFPPNTLLDYNDLRYELAGVTTTVPEPSSVVLMASGMLAVGFMARRRRKV